MVQLLKRQADREASCIIFDQYFIYNLVNTVFIHMTWNWEKNSHNNYTRSVIVIPRSVFLGIFLVKHLLNCITNS